MNSLRIENISKKYPTVDALQNVSLNVNAGEVVGIFGEKKSGKRTLINIILGKTIADAGYIFYNGDDITNLPARKRQSLGLVNIDYEFNQFQNVCRKFFPEESILEYLLKIIPDHNRHLNKVIREKEKCEIIESVLHSFNSQAYINRGFHEQSAGQSRKVKLASCFMRQPDFVIIDDPFYGLDYTNAKDLFEKISEYSHAQRIGFLFSMDVTDLDYLNCDRVYLMQSGKIMTERNSIHKVNSNVPNQADTTDLLIKNDIIKQSRKQTGINFNVFICFKNTDEKGNQTRDNYLAHEIFKYLKERGINAFYSYVSLENLGIAAYQKAIDEALDNVDILIAVGTSATNLNAEWVRYEWGSFYNDILSGRKKKGRLFVYTDNINISDLPRILRQNQVIEHNENSFETLYNFVVHALNDSY